MTTGNTPVSKKPVKKRSISTQRLIKENRKALERLGLEGNITVDEYLGDLADALVDELTS